jgi:dTDP-4-amino-4,6-dideoxygalactose transaminase
VKPGEEVIVPSFTFYATAAAVARLGATPVFADSDETYNISLDDMAKKLTKKTRAVIPVHLFGQMADMEGINSLVKNRGITIIEDAAQSMGAEINGKQTGLWGDFTAYSFYPTKNLGAMGDAGMMACLTEENAEKLKMLRVHGSFERYYHEAVGINSRLDSMQAALLRVKMRHLREYENARGRHAELYTKLFRDAGLDDFIRLPVVRKNIRHVWNQFTIRAKNRDKLRAALQEQKIGSEIYYPLPMHEQKAFASAGFKHGDLKNCEAMAKEVLSLPMFPELVSTQVERVVEAVKKFYR